MRPAHPRLARRRGKNRFHQLRVEAPRQPDRLWKASASNGCMPVQALFVEEHRNAKAAVLEEKPLNRVRQLGHSAGVFAFARIARPAYLPQAVSLPESLSSL